MDRRWRVFALGSAVVFLGGCSWFGGSSATPPEKISEEISGSIERQWGAGPDSVDCPGELPAEIGAEIRCVLKDDRVSYGVTVTYVGKSEDNPEGIQIVVDSSPIDEPLVFEDDGVLGTPIPDPPLPPDAPSGQVEIPSEPQQLPAPETEATAAPEELSGVSGPGL